MTSEKITGPATQPPRCTAANSSKIDSQAVGSG